VTVLLGAICGAAIGSLALFLAPFLPPWLILSLGSALFLYPSLAALFVKISWVFFVLSVILFDETGTPLPSMPRLPLPVPPAATAWSYLTQCID
jgi:hypothetical protein